MKKKYCQVRHLKNLKFVIRDILIFVLIKLKTIIRKPKLFCLIEFGIGCFGLLSHQLILNLQDMLIHANLVMTAWGSFILLLFPTFLMGTTLPLLTSFFNQYIQNIGDSVGQLYFYNTLGAAFGALATGFILFNQFTLSHTINIAAMLNLAISFLVFIAYGRK